MYSFNDGPPNISHTVIIVPAHNTRAPFNYQHRRCMEPFSRLDMVCFTVSPSLIEYARDSQCKSLDVMALLERPYISRDALYSLYLEDSASYSSFLEFIAHHNLTLKLDTPAPPISPPKTPEFIKSMEILRSKALEQEYRDLVDPPSHSTLFQTTDLDELLSPAQAGREAKSHVTTIFNILVSVASVAYAVWYWTATSWALPPSLRVLLCVFFALLVLVAEVVVYLGYLNRIEEARVRERSKKEVKTVVRLFKLS